MIDELRKCLVEQRTARNLCVEAVDITDAELNGLRSDGIEVIQASFSSGDLRNTIWRNILMSDVKMQSVDLEHAAFRLCQLKNLTAENCNFKHAKIENTDARGAVFDYSNFRDSSLFESDFSRASLREVDLSNSVVTGLNLRGADLRGANCSGVDFDEVDLRGADLRGANLHNVSLEGADIAGALVDQYFSTATGATDSVPQFSEQTQEIVDAVSPVLAKLIRSGGDALSMEPDKQNHILEQLEGLTNYYPDKDSSNNELQDNAINAILTRVGSTDILSLMEALKNTNDTPSDKVANLIQGLSNDLDLESGATAEDLLAKLLRSMR